jgi:hypothetical protein
MVRIIRIRIKIKTILSDKNRKEGILFSTHKALELKNIFHFYIPSLVDRWPYPICNSY